MVVTQMEPGVVCVLAPNPGPLTGPGTNSYLVGTRDLCLIDPGPDDPRHRDALLRAIAGRRVRAIVLTHSHRDHSGLARGMAGAVGAPVLAYGRPAAGRRPFIAGLVASGALPQASGEGVQDLMPDRVLVAGEVIAGAGWRLRILHTPGHMANHIALQMGDALFVGDTILGTGTTVIAPPDGDMAAYMATLGRLARLGARRLYPGHGAPLDDPARAIADIVHHRGARALQIWSALALGPVHIGDLRAGMYPELGPPLWRAAEMNIRAHLIEMMEQGLVVADAPLPGNPRFRRV